MEDQIPEENLPSKSSRKWDTSIVIAVIAVLISTISTFIGVKESNIMLTQQKISLEQQAASVWPYLENIPINEYDGQELATFQLIVRNKGVGPAIIDSVIYDLDGMNINGWSLGDEMAKNYPSLKVSHLQNSRLDGKVLSPGETHSVIKIKIQKDPLDTIQLSDVLNNINFNLNYCYCSIYGKCWQITNNNIRSVSESCQLAESIK